MRQRQSGLIDLEIVIGEKIDVDGTRAPALFSQAIAPEPAFNVEGALEQSARRQWCGDLQAEIDEVRLILDAPWFRFVVGRARDQGDIASVAKECDGLVERLANAAGIAAERNQCLSHGANG
jgi:hypothetical protein